MGEPRISSVTGGPKCVLLISGKRKCGKDYMAEYLKDKLTVDKCIIVRISEPIKKCFATTNNLDLKELMSDGPYKEKYRLEMIHWSDEQRAKDPGFFCAISCETAPIKPIWIVSDIRRKTDIRWFKEVYGTLVKCIRISADEEVRKRRGWVFQAGVDDVASECDLDNFKAWDEQITNNDDVSFQEGVNKLSSIVFSHL